MISSAATKFMNEQFEGDHNGCLEGGASRSLLTPGRQATRLWSADGQCDVLWYRRKAEERGEEGEKVVKRRRKTEIRVGNEGRHEVEGRGGNGG
ncbi:hypothetical protein E2C01_053359 [Portunus trituberculatus]|uniref:Uncharacterized protein n=1 Tax=Portunus trituberculatus TaxID=210409 RepID=A0A5B7GGD3_PORTR|nr:hypothetical protein [Portunus trituberculatus]